MGKGQFVWFEAITPDIGKSVDFYTGLFGWKVEKQKYGGMEYLMFRAGEREVAGVVTPPGAETAAAHWLSYLGVDDVDRAARFNETEGGHTLVPTFEIPAIGRTAILQDPQGAVFAPFKGAQEMPPQEPAPFTFSWNELMVKDPEKAKRFYAELTGWNYQPFDMGPMGIYHVARVGETPVAGMMGFPPGVPEFAHWLPYVSVPQVDETTAQVAGLGGMVHMGPQDIPEVGRFSLLGDPVGAVLAVITFIPR